MLANLRALYTTEPARLVAVTVAVLVVVANATGVALDGLPVGELVAIALTVLLGGEATRHRVSPALPELDEPSDDRLPDLPVARDHGIGEDV